MDWFHKSDGHLSLKRQPAFYRRLTGDRANNDPKTGFAMRPARLLRSQTERERAAFPRLLSRPIRVTTTEAQFRIWQEFLITIFGIRITNLLHFASNFG